MRQTHFHPEITAVHNMHKTLFEGGSLTVSSGIKVLELRGTWHEMGRQYGHLASEYIGNIYRFTADKTKGSTEAEKLSERLYSNYPFRLKQFFSGMEETSGLGLDRLKTANAMEYLEGYFGCSAIAVWGPYSKEGLIYGRNYDGMSFSSLGENILLTVFHPSDGSMAFAIAGYAGEIYAVNGINENGLFIELNNGMPSGGFDVDFDMDAGTTELMTALSDRASLSEMEAFFRTRKSSAAFIIGVADSAEARCYEWCHDGMKRADGQTPVGLMVMTNHYVNPDWQFATLDDAESWMTSRRRNNLLSAAESGKGLFDSKLMCRLMETPLEEGGPMLKETLYQMVWNPDSSILRMRIPGITDGWAEICLKDYF